MTNSQTVVVQTDCLHCLLHHVIAACLKSSAKEDYADYVLACLLQTTAEFIVAAVVDTQTRSEIAREFAAQMPDAIEAALKSKFAQDLEPLN